MTIERISLGGNAYAWFVKETSEYEILVLPFLVTHAVATFPKARGHAFPNWYEDRWCYADFSEAITAACEWDGAPGSEPPGNWITRK